MVAFSGLLNPFLRLNEINVERKEGRKGRKLQLGLETGGFLARRQILQVGRGPKIVTGILVTRLEGRPQTSLKIGKKIRTAVIKTSLRQAFRQVILVFLKRRNTCK